MPPEERNAALLLDMLEAARLVQRFVDGKSVEDYRLDVLLRSAVERQIEIIGEAARRVSVALRQAHPQIPWTAIAAQRHVLAHDYGDIDDERIWRVAAMHVPTLIHMLELLIQPPEDADRTRGLAPAS